MARLKRRADDRIHKQVYLGKKPDGSNDYVSVYGRTQKEAEEKADELKAAKRKGLDITARRDTFKIWGERLLRLKKGEKLAAQRIVVYESHLKHLYRYLENVPIMEIRPSDLQDILLDLGEKNPNTGRPMAEETLKGLKSAMKQVFDLAIDNRVLEYNPAVRLRVPKTGKPFARRALTEQEQRWILDTPHRCQRPAMIMMYSGLCRGELIPLQWTDIDLEAGTISVNKAVEFIKGKAQFKDSAKNEYRLRTVKIPQRLVDYLKKQPRESIYVCTSARNKVHTDSSWKRMWESYRADLNIKYGDFSPFEKEREDGSVRKIKSKFDPEGVPFVIPKISAHWLRHTFCTIMRRSGVRMETAIRQMGHADATMVAEVYSHLDDQDVSQDMGLFDAYLDPAEVEAAQAEK